MSEWARKRAFNTLNTIPGGEWRTRAVEDLLDDVRAECAVEARRETVATAKGWLRKKLAQIALEMEVAMQASLERPTFNHDRADGPFDPCDACLEKMTREELLAYAQDQRKVRGRSESATGIPTGCTGHLVHGEFHVCPVHDR